MESDTAEETKEIRRLNQNPDVQQKLQDQQRIASFATQANERMRSAPADGSEQVLPEARELQELACQLVSKLVLAPVVAYSAEHKSASWIKEFNN